MRPNGGPGLRPLAAVLAAWVAAVFLPSLLNGFVWDDTQYVLGNPRVLGGLTWGGVRWALTSLELANWHPLTWVSHMADVELFGARAWGPHLVNLLLHAANAVLLFVFLARLTGAPWRSLLVALLFGVHPLHVESVAWIAERKDLLSTFLGFAALGAYLRAVRRPGRLRSVTVLLLFGIGLAAKPMLVTLPCVMLLLDAWPLGRLTRSSWRRPLLEKLPLLALSAAVSAVTVVAQRSAGAVSDYPLDARISNALVGAVRYLAKTAAPFDLAAFYPHAGVALPRGQVLGSLLLLVLVTALAAAAYRRRPWLAIGWLWFVGTLVPVSGLVQVGQQAIADRYTYVPLVGVFIMVIWSVGGLPAGRPRRQAAALVLGAALAVALSAASWVQVGYWRDTVSLFTHAVDVTSGNWLAEFNLGSHYQARGETGLAAAHYRAAVRARPDYEKALNNLGTIAAAAGRPAEAIGYFQAALAAHPGFEESLLNLGVELMKLGRLPEAEIRFLEALRRNPEFYEAREQLAEMLLRQRRWSEAEAQFREVLRRHPESARARNWLGVTLASQGRFDEASAVFEQILRSDPGDPDARANLARARARLAR